MAKLYFSYAAMNAGKSTMLLQASYNYRERGMHTLLFTAAFDDRAGVGRIASRIGFDCEADLYTPSDNLYDRIAVAHAGRRVDCAFFDEAQFLTTDQVWQLARLVDRLKVPVMC
ncbi:MAG: thymidine kinase, partial [Cucumibacter sp.]